MLMTFNQRLLCCVLGSLVLVIAAFDLFKAEPLVVRAEGERITIEFYPTGESEKVNPVALSFSGKVYENLVLPDSPEKSNLTEDEAFLAKAIAINKSGTLEDVLSLWSPSERPGIRKVAEDPKIFEANQKFYGAIEKSSLKAKILYGTYTIYIVKHSGASGEILKDYPVKKVEGKYFLTNALKEDPVFQYLTTKYIKKLRELK